jgi:hypothetical protein
MSVCQLMVAFIANLKQFRNMHSDDIETGEQKNSSNVVDGCSPIKHDKQLIEVKSKTKIIKLAFKHFLDPGLFVDKFFSDQGDKTYTHQKKPVEFSG